YWSVTGVQTCALPISRGVEPKEIRRTLPGDPEDIHSRYIEASVHDVTIGCLYLPNGNPAPGPKFDYKLKWLDRLIEHAAELVKRSEERRVGKEGRSRG